MDEQELEEEFHISRYIIFYKLILGIIELVLGFGILIYGRMILDIYREFRNSELLEDPHDLLVRVLETVMPFLAQHMGYLIFILILLGVVKIVGAIGLLYHKHWGLDLLIGVTIILLPFELYNLFTHLSLSHFGYFVINLLIALYLVNFDPKGYFSKIKTRYSSKV